MVTMQEKRPRRKYTKDFKLEAVRRLREGYKSGPALSKELGISRSLLYLWKEQVDSFGQLAFPGNGRKLSKSEEYREIGRLNKKLKQLEEENAVLKKTVQLFALQSQNDIG